MSLVFYNIEHRIPRIFRPLYVHANTVFQFQKYCNYSFINFFLYIRVEKQTERYFVTCQKYVLRIIHTIFKFHLS